MEKDRLEEFWNCIQYPIDFSFTPHVEEVRINNIVHQVYV